MRGRGGLWRVGRKLLGEKTRAVLWTQYVSDSYLAIPWNWVSGMQPDIWSRTLGSHWGQGHTLGSHQRGGAVSSYGTDLKEKVNRDREEKKKGRRTSPRYLACQWSKEERTELWWGQAIETSQKWAVLGHGSETRECSEEKTLHDIKWSKVRYMGARYCLLVWATGNTNKRALWGKAINWSGKDISSDRKPGSFPSEFHYSLDVSD